MDPGVWEEITKMVEQVPGILGVIKNVGGAKNLDLEKKSIKSFWIEISKKYSNTDTHYNIPRTYRVKTGHK